MNMYNRAKNLGKYTEKGNIPWNKGKIKREKIICLTCGNDVLITPSRKNIAKYCSLKCLGIKRSQRLKEKRIKFNCENCEKIFYKAPSRVKIARFCSDSCRAIKIGLLHMGKNNSSWKGGVTPLFEKIRKSNQYLEWASNIKKVWNYTCQICGVKGGKLHSNHIKKFSDYPKLRFVLTNGITLCVTCHRLVTGHEKEWESYFTFCWESKFLKEGDSLCFLH